MSFCSFYKGWEIELVPEKALQWTLSYFLDFNWLSRHSCPIFLFSVYSFLLTFDNWASLFNIWGINLLTIDYDFQTAIFISRLKYLRFYCHCMCINFNFKGVYLEKDVKYLTNIVLMFETYDVYHVRGMCI